MITKVQGLVTLLYGYVVALFIVQSQVMDCQWLLQGKRDTAKPLLIRCLRVHKLNTGYEDKCHCRCQVAAPAVVHRLAWTVQ